MKPRRTWQLLVDQAEAQCVQAQAELNRARQRCQQLQARRERLLTLQHEYQQRCRATEIQRHAIGQSLQLRNFLHQLQSLLARLMLDLAKAEQQELTGQRSLLAAQKKHLQLDALLQADLQRVRQQLRQSEQRALDAMAVLLHTRKP